MWGIEVKNIIGFGARQTRMWALLHHFSYVALVTLLYLSFNTLNIALHSLLVYMVSDKKSR